MADSVGHILGSLALGFLDIFSYFWILVVQGAMLIGAGFYFVWATRSYPESSGARFAKRRAEGKAWYDFRDGPVPEDADWEDVEDAMAEAGYAGVSREASERKKRRIQQREEKKKLLTAEPQQQEEKEKQQTIEVQQQQTQQQTKIESVSLDIDDEFEEVEEEDEGHAGVFDSKKKGKKKTAKQLEIEEEGRSGETKKLKGIREAKEKNAAAASGADREQLLP